MTDPDFGSMNPLPLLRRHFSHPFPAAMIFFGLGLWALSTVWAIVGFILTEVASVSLLRMALLSAVIGILGALVLLVGIGWYGFLLLFDARAEFRRTRDAR